jgi:hypothetical protein
MECGARKKGFNVKSRSIAVQAAKLIGSTEPVSQQQRVSGGEEDRTRREQWLQTCEEKEAI